MGDGGGRGPRAPRRFRPGALLARPRRPADHGDGGDRLGISNGDILNIYIYILYYIIIYIYIIHIYVIIYIYIQIYRCVYIIRYRNWM